MEITNETNPTVDFTRIPNEVIFNTDLTAAEFRLWCQLAALPKGDEAATVNTVDKLAGLCGVDRDSCRDRRRNLKDKGFIRNEGKDIVVTIPDEGFKPKEVKLTKEQQLRHDLRDIWNKNKPDGYSKLKNPLAVGQIETLKQHAGHNGVTNLGQFLASVLKGCKAEDWWKDKTLNFGNVFGTGSPKQNKFTNVEKLFKLAGSSKGRAALWDFDSDQDWIDWFEAKGHTMKQVARLEMEQDDAWVHQVDNEGDGTIYVYSAEGRVVHWTYKESQSHGVRYLPTAK